MQNSKMSGKIREKSGNFDVDDKWQPCSQVPAYAYAENDDPKLLWHTPLK